MKKLFLCLVIIIIGIVGIYNTQGFAYTVDFTINSGISYQDDDFDYNGDGATTITTYNNTSELQYKDGDWGLTPLPAGSVVYGYYATGGAQEWFDGISLNFDLSSVGHTYIKSATLMAYIRTGEYSTSWHHYNAYQGAMNATDQDSNPTGLSFGHAAYQNGGWISYDIPISWITSDNFDVSLRLWNAYVDQVKLEANVVPEPMSMSLLGMGLLGAFGARFRRKKLG